jgi:hypothetical protein
MKPIEMTAEEHALYMAEMDRREAEARLAQRADKQRGLGQRANRAARAAAHAARAEAKRRKLRRKERDRREARKAAGNAPFDHAKARPARRTGMAKFVHELNRAEEQINAEQKVFVERRRLRDRRRVEECTMGHCHCHRHCLVATTVSATRKVRVFTVVNNRPHKLLAWRRRSADGKNEWVIVANRDEPTCNNMLLIYVRALLRKARALQLSRLSTFLGSAQQRRNPASVATKGFA